MLVTKHQNRFLHGEMNSWREQWSVQPKVRLVSQTVNQTNVPYVVPNHCNLSPQQLTNQPINQPAAEKPNQAATSAAVVVVVLLPAAVAVVVLLAITTTTTTTAASVVGSAVAHGAPERPRSNPTFFFWRVSLALARSDSLSWSRPDRSNSHPFRLGDDGPDGWLVGWVSVRRHGRLYGFGFDGSGAYHHHHQEQRVFCEKRGLPRMGCTTTI